ncbi:TRAP transporter large permease subunit [Halobacillus litoralis]|uniref:TRAP transporter large permease subunit n=2 Tax=Halobacillus litoralis TaxID=45668 RepID=A0A845F7H4_9BACI|nr:TRAP transporter large permease subunit [Halobacillus litoralis]
MIVYLAIEFITSPVSVNLFVAENIAGTKFEKLVCMVIPFIIIIMIDVLIVSFLPFLSLWFIQ